MNDIIPVETTNYPELFAIVLMSLLIGFILAKITEKKK